MRRIVRKLVLRLFPDITQVYDEQREFLLAREIFCVAGIAESHIEVCKIRASWRYPRDTLARLTIISGAARTTPQGGIGHVIKVSVIYRIILFIVFDSSCFSYRALQFLFHLLLFDIDF